MYNVPWEFRSGEFTVRLRIEPEETPPEDMFEFREDIDAIHNGTVDWFVAIVEVLRNGHVIGRDTLGGCAYNSIREFYTAHRDPDPMNRNSSIMRAAQGDNVAICHYFPDMVRQTIADARATLGRGEHHA